MVSPLAKEFYFRAFRSSVSLDCSFSVMIPLLVFGGIIGFYSGLVASIVSSVDLGFESFK
jgi:hypothetical protein